MRVAAISDLHIGVEAGRDGFGHAVRDFEAWLGRLEGEHDRVVLVGDIFQSDHGVVPGSRAGQLHAARKRARALVRRFEGAGYHYVHGNHDEIAHDELGTPSSVVLEDHGLRLGFTHGHAFDPVALRAPWLADVGTYATGTLRRVGLVGWARWFEHRDVAIKHRRFGGDAGPYARGADALASHENLAVVVLGHTHAAELHRTTTAVYANSGTCSDGRRECVSIDTAAGTISLWRWPIGAQTAAMPTVGARRAIRPG
jgi:predicted phosphodiesterase